MFVLLDFACNFCKACFHRCVRVTDVEFDVDVDARKSMMHKEGDMQAYRENQPGPAAVLCKHRAVSGVEVPGDWEVPGAAGSGWTGALGAGGEATGLDSGARPVGLLCAAAGDWEAPSGGPGLFASRFSGRAGGAAKGQQLNGQERLRLVRERVMARTGQHLG